MGVFAGEEEKYLTLMSVLAGEEEKRLTLMGVLAGEEGKMPHSQGRVGKKKK